MIDMHLSTKTDHLGFLKLTEPWGSNFTLSVQKRLNAMLLLLLLLLVVVVVVVVVVVAAVAVAVAVAVKNNYHFLYAVFIIEMGGKTNFVQAH